MRLWEYGSAGPTKTALGSVFLCGSPVERQPPSSLPGQEHLYKLASCVS
jgi:hypothetical protein